MKGNKVVKVLHITSYPPPRSGWGIRVYFLKQEMERQGDICEVLNTGKGRQLKGRDFIPLYNGFDYVWKVFKYRLKGYLIHIHLNGDSPKKFIMTIIAQIISLLTFRRTVITFHAGPVQRYFPQFKAPYLIPMYKFIFTEPKYIICNNEAVKKNIAGYGIHPDKIVPIQSFSKQYLQFHEVPFEGRVKTIFDTGDPVIVSYVYFRPEFFVHDLIRFFKQFVGKYPKAYLVIIGHESGSEPIKQLIDELRLNDRIYFAGDLDHDTFLTYLKRATLFLRTPVKDGVCSSVLEALALKTPVVASENGSRPEGVITYQNGNIDDMVKKVQYVVENLDAVRKQLKEPDIPDTVNQEIQLIRKAYWE